MVRTLLDRPDPNRRTARTTEPKDGTQTVKSETPIYTQLVIERASADPEARELADAILRRKQAQIRAHQIRAIQIRTQQARRTPVQAFTEWLRG